MLSKIDKDASGFARILGGGEGLRFRDYGD